MKVLITGAAGFLGNAMRQWIENNRPDVKLTLIDSGALNQSGDPEIIQADLAQDELEDLFHVDVVYHFAAWPFEHFGEQLRAQLWWNNTLATSRVVEWCIETKAHLVFSSSVAVFGRSHAHNESSPCYPVDVYGSTKLASECDIRCASSSGLRWTIVRLGSLYGPYQPYCKLRNVFSTWGTEDTIKVVGTGLQKRAWTWIYDVLEPLWTAWSYSNMTFNMMAQDHHSVLDAAQMVRNLTGKEIEYIPTRREVFRPTMGGMLAEKYLKFKETVPLKEGLATMLSYPIPVSDLDHLRVTC